MTIDWNNAQDAAGMVSIGDNSLFVRVYGPHRDPSTPVIILEAGLSDSSRWWTGVAKELKQSCRVFTYDRSGLGRSELSNASRTAENIAIELEKLLKATNVKPPYILVGHSYAGILVREFAGRNLEDVAGLVLIDTNTERTHVDMNPPWADLFAIGGDLSYFSMTKLEDEHALDPKEWQAIQKEGSEENGASGEREQENPSAEQLGQQRQFENCVMGDRPVVVIKANSIKDYTNIYNAGTQAGNGTEAQKASMQAFIKRMPLEEEIQAEQLKLSRNSRWVYMPDFGHNVHITAPVAVANEIRSLYSQVTDGKTNGV